MKKYVMVLGLIFPLLLFAEPNKQSLPDPKVNCKDFLMAGVVKEQIQEEALGMPDTAIYRVTYHEEKDYCDLLVKNKATGKTYEFTSKNTDNLEFDPQQRIFALKLFSKDKPDCENFVEADYEDVTNAFIDADYDFSCLSEEGKN